MWIQRRRKHFYYRSVRDRETGQPKTVYIGSASSTAAQQAAQVDARKKLQQRQSHAARKARESMYKDILRSREAVDLLTEGFFLANNFHFHKGEWHHHAQRLSTE